MADPISISMAATLAGGAVAGGGSVLGGLQKGAMSDYEASVAKMNAQIARQNAAMDLAAGETQQAELGLKERAERSQMAATQGASGLDMRSGTAVAVRNSADEMARIDQANILYGAKLRAYGNMVKATEQDAQATVDTMQASMYRTAGYIGAASSILGATGQAYSTQAVAQMKGLSPSISLPTFG